MTSTGAQACGLVFGTVSDPLLAAALWTGCGALAATAALLGAIVVIRARLLRRLARERSAAALWNPLLAQCAERTPAVLPPLRPSDAESFLVLWCRAQEALRGEAQDHLREMARRLQIGPLAHRLVRSGRLRLELLALVTLGHLRDASVVPLLLDQVSRRPSVVSLTAGQALIRIDATAGVPRVLAATAKRADWPLARVVSMLKECDPGLVARILSAAIRTELHKKPDDAAAGGLARLLRLHVAAHGETLRDSVLAALSTATNTEVLTAALDALEHPQDVVHARRLLGHAEWPVRVAAARALGRLGSGEDFTPLRTALADANWWVRYRAAQALCALPSADPGALRRLPGLLTDRFAADILRQALADRDFA